MRKWIVPFMSGLAMIVVSGAAPAAPGYGYYYTVGAIHVVDLGTLGGDFSEAAGINDLGDVVGYAHTADGKVHAFIHTGGQMFALDDGSVPFDSAVGNAINNSRVVVGGFRDALGDHPFYYYPGIWSTPLSADAAPGLGYLWRGTASSINNAGVIAGGVNHPIYQNPSPPDPPGYACYNLLPVRWANAAANPISLFCPPDPDGDHQGSAAYVLDINDAGDMVGQDGASSSHSMFLYKNGARLAVPSPAGLPETQSGGSPIRGHARGINNKNWVVGDYDPPDPVTGQTYRAFLWDGTSAHSMNLGLLPNGTESTAFDINESNMVAGHAKRTYGTTSMGVGFIWHSDFGMKQLPALSYTGPLQALVPRYCAARAISEIKAGVVQLAGFCENASGKAHAVRWDITINTVIYPLPSASP